MKKKNIIVKIPEERIGCKILLIRDKKVMLDRDLAGLYGVEVKYLKRQVRRNIERFPVDFMFELSEKEFENWRCQFVTSKSDKKGLRYKPFVFTEHGILMLSSVLNSNRAIQVNIQIMRTFVKLREFLATHKELQKKIEEHDAQIKYIFQMLQNLLNPPEPPPPSQTLPKQIKGFLRDKI
ncbi:MAG: ORF6N domain-containing protein [Elusimicrobiota bacterium]